VCYVCQPVLADKALTIVKKYLRLLTILRIAARYRLQDLLAGFESKGLTTLLLIIPFRASAEAKQLSRGARLRRALEELGPIFIKFGQLLSTRRDLVPLDIADELAYLQDQVPPFDGAQAQDIIEKALGGSIETFFSDFSSTPLASASIAQVHTAKLLSGEEVVIKVLRPDIEKVISQDLSLMHHVAKLIERYLKAGKRLHAREVVRDYDMIINDEMNLLAEGANGSQLAKNFENNDTLYVPKVYWDYTRINVLVMERVYGIPVSHIDELEAANINMKKLAETGVEIFFTQVFNHSFFHADMHPGNIFVSREHPEKPQYIALDCAIFGSLNTEDQQYLARNLLAIFKRDYRRVAELHVECGWVPPDTPVHAFESAMRSVCEPIFEKPLKDISYGNLLLQLFRTANRFNMEIQPSLVLLQKTLLNVEGLGKQLYPDLDLWQTALPFLEEWQRKRLSPWHNLKKLKEKLPEWLEQAPETPELLLDLLLDYKKSRQASRKETLRLELERLKQEHKQSKKRLCYGLGAVFIAALLTFSDSAAFLQNLPSAAWLLIVAGFSLFYFRR